MLGTVQFGQPYGVANRTGQPDQAQVTAMISTALDGGVNCLDTAAAYGASEVVLGQALRKLGVSDRVVVVTKVRPLQAEQLDDPHLAEQAIESCIAVSRERLGIDCLPIVLFHCEADARHFSVLTKLRRRGWLRYAGVSCANRPGFLSGFKEIGGLDAVQLPANLLDQRHRTSGAFQTAAANGMAVFIRSVYLQGLLVMPENDIPHRLRQVTQFRRALAEIAQQAGMSLRELALRHMLDQTGVTSVLVGVETEAQVRDNLAICSRGVLPPDVCHAVQAAATDVPEMLITPSMWPQAALPASNSNLDDAT
jgi:aryl-alcohol dehydrogenase-like predicted oxidoreductase